MNKISCLKETINRILYYPMYNREIYSVFHYNSLPYLSPSEELLLRFMISDKSVRPRFRLVKKTGEFTPLEALLIPSEYEPYRGIISKKQNFFRYKKSLIDKHVLFETEYGLLVNMSFIPLKCKKCMTYLRKISKIPNAPIE